MIIVDRYIGIVDREINRTSYHSREESHVEGVGHRATVSVLSDAVGSFRGGDLTLYARVPPISGIDNRKRR